MNNTGYERRVVVIPGGKQPHEKEERNCAIYLGWKDGMTFRELGKRHGISRQAAHRIVFKRKYAGQT